MSEVELSLDARIKELLQTDMSYGAIGKQLGISRSAVAGKISRMRQRGEISPTHIIQFPRSDPSHPIAKAVMRDERIALKKWVEVREVPPPPGTRAVHLLDLREADCRYPMFYTVSRGHFFCGEPRRDNKTRYCEKHHSVVWRPRKP